VKDVRFYSMEAAAIVRTIRASEIYHYHNKSNFEMHVNPSRLPSVIAGRDLSHILECGTHLEERLTMELMNT